MFNDYAVNSSPLYRRRSDLAGSLSLVVTTRGVFANELSGSSVLRSTGNLATLAQATPQSATVALTVTTAGALQVVVYWRPFAINGAALNTYTVNAPNARDLATSVTLRVTAAAALQKSLVFAGVSSLSLTTTGRTGGTMTVALNPVTCTATVTGALTKNANLATSITTTLLTSGALRLQIPLVGTSSLVVTGSGTISKLTTPGAVSSTYTTTAPLLTYSVAEIEASVTDSAINIAVQTDSIYVNVQ